MPKDILFVNHSTGEGKPVPIERSPHADAALDSLKAFIEANKGGNK